MAYPCWLIAREYILYGHCNIRILIASEVIVVARKMVRGIRQILEHNGQYKKYFGDHQPRNARGNMWSDAEITSRHRNVSYIGEPTVSTMSLGAPRAGMHYEVIIPDDLQTDRSTSSPDQIDKCWDFYYLMHPLLEPKLESYLTWFLPVIPGPVMSLVSTRWHFHDIYYRIAEAAKNNPVEEERFSILIKPVILTDGTLTFPSRFPQEKIDELRRSMSAYLFSCQYLLIPADDESRSFKKAWIRYVTPQHFNQQSLQTYVVADIAFTEQSSIARGEHFSKAFSVVFTIHIDEQWNYIMQHAFRKQCRLKETLNECLWQHKEYNAQIIVMQKFDQVRIEETFEQVCTEANQHPYIEYISYPSKQNKDGRIETNLQPIMQMGKLFILPGLDWLEDEFLSFPNSMYKDGMDALCNAVVISAPPPASEMNKEMTMAMLHIENLKRGRVTSIMDGRLLSAGSKKKSQWAHIYSGD